MDGYSVYLFADSRSVKVAWFLSLTDAQCYADNLYTEMQYRTNKKSIITITNNDKIIYKEKAHWA